MTWYALVPPSVAAMSATMVVNGDPNASSGQTSLLVVVSLVFAAIAAWVYWPLMREETRARRGRMASPGGAPAVAQ